MPDPSGTRFEVLRSNTKRRFSLAALLIAAGALSFGAQAQTTTNVSNQAATEAGLQAAVQDGIQTIQTARATQTSKAKSSDQTAEPSHLAPTTLLAQNEAPQGATVAQTPADQPTDQTADQSASGQNQLLQEVVVTGTMIRRTSTETAEAITIVQPDALKAQGVTNVEQALNTLTANSPQINIASSVGTFSGGGTYADLRNLGDGRTLVLLDGERLAPNAFSGNAVDLNGIPFSAIQSVQVLREGASALYGSDAIAGVINFITKKNFQGAEIEGQLDHPQEDGGGSNQLDIVLGHGDLVNDGYNAMLTVDYTHQQELQASERAFSAYGFNPAGGYTSTNYPGNWPGLFIDGAGNAWQPGYPACAGNNALTTYFGDCEYRYSAATDLLPDSHELSGLLSLTKTLPANNQLQLQYFLTQSEITDFSGPMFYSFDISPTSPYFPTSAAGLTCESAPCTAPDLTDFGHVYLTDPNNERYTGNFNVEQRLLLTFSGSNAGWDYTTDINVSRNTNDNRNVKDYPDEAILAPTTNPATGNPIISNLINPFGPQSAAGQALIDSSYINGVYEIGKDTRWSVDGNASHPLGDVFNANSPATFAVGFDVGGERFTNYTTPYNDLVSAATGLTDFNATGSRQTQALYSELDVPLPHKIDLDVSDRQDRYSDFGLTNNGKLALRYQPAGFLTLRGTASTGFRAPTLFDLYQSDFLTAATSGTMGAGNPYCESGNYTPLWTKATCDTQGLALNGGNRTLTPETSENFDLGAIVNPVANLGVTVDYFRIVLKNTIGQVPPQGVYQDPNALAAYIVPNAAGTLTASINEASQCLPYTAPTCGYVLHTNQNTGFEATDGLDLSVQYMLRTAFGRLNFDLEGTDVTQFLEQQFTGGPTLSLVDWWNQVATGPVYHWEHYARIDWTSPGSMWGAGINNRFYSHFRDQFPNGAGDVVWVGTYSLWDIYGSVKPIKNLNVLFGIKNLFNTSPPYTNAYQDNFASGYDALTADPILRDFYVDLKYDFF